MKLCAIISEYNPFHNGHFYHIQESLKKSGCDHAICVMNSNFSQRGEPTIVDKKTRALMAIEGGVSAVMELPTYFSVANAEVFAYAAVKTVCSFKDVTHLSFGSECGDIESIKELAKFLDKEPPFFKSIVKDLLKNGFSLGISKVKALAECISKNLVKFTRPDVVLDLLSKPNNILAVEYVKALLKLKSNIIPITIKRQEPYKGYELDFDYKLSSASDIRNSILNSKHIWNIRKYIPPKCFYIFAEYLKEHNIPDQKLLGQCALYKLRTTSPSELKLNYDVVEGFENKLVLSARESTNFEQFMQKTVSRRYSNNRVKRIVMSCLLNLRSEITQKVFEIEKMPFVKVLACINDKKLLASLKNADTIVVTRKTDAMQAVQDQYAKQLVFAENRANAFYELLINTDDKQQMQNAEVNSIFDKTLFVNKNDFLRGKTVME